MNATQPIETITPLPVGEASPRGFMLYRIVHPDGSWTIRNLTESDGLYTGSFTPLPETFSERASDEREQGSAQRRNALVMAEMLK